MNNDDSSKSDVVTPEDSGTETASVNQNSSTEASTEPVSTNSEQTATTEAEATPTEPVTPSATTEPAASTPEVTTSPNVAATPVTKPKSHKKWLLPALVAAGVVLLGGGAFAYFGPYQHAPEQVWKHALGNTAQGYKIFAKSKPATKKGIKATGTYKITAPLVADGTINFNADDKNFKLQLDAGSSGVRANFEARGIASASSTPDLYVQLSGVKGIGSLLGVSGKSEIATLLASVDNQWFLVDHTLFDQMASGGGSAGQVSAVTSESPEQLQNDIYDASQKLSTVVTDRLLTSNPKKAVFVIKDKLGKEDFKGRQTQHFRVTVQKAHLHDALVELKDTLKSTKLSSLLGANGKDKKFEDVSGFNSMISSIDATNFDKTSAEVWVDSGLQYIRNIRVSALDAKGAKTGSIDFFFDYKGGDELPVLVTITSNEVNNEGTVALGVTLKQKVATVDFTASVDAKSNGQKLAGKAELKLEPTDDKTPSDRPAGAKNLLDLVAPLLLQFQSGTPPNVLR